jgi:Type II CAAX prenyl endopeptidase Rce1-like
MGGFWNYWMNRCTIKDVATANTAVDAEPHVAPRPSRLRVVVEMVVPYVLILLVIWTPRPWQGYLWWVAAASVVIITSISFDGLPALGLRMTNFWRSLWVVGAALLLAGAAILIASRLHTLHLPPGPLAFVATYCAYALWSAVQQFLLQGIFLQRLMRLIPNGTGAALAASVLFASAHLPSAILTPMTLIWGFVACLIFLRYRNLYPLAIAHAVLGITVAMTIPGPIDHNMRVGLGYLTYHRHAHIHSPHPVAPPLPQP